MRMMFRKDGLNRGFAFLEFHSEEQARQFKEFHKVDIHSDEQYIYIYIHDIYFNLYLYITLVRIDNQNCFISILNIFKQCYIHYFFINRS